MKGRLVVMSCDSPVSFTMFRTSVPSPVPVLAVTVHCVAGRPPTGVTPVTAGVPPRPTFTRVKLLPVRLMIGFAKVTVHETGSALVGVLPLRLIETTVVSGRSTGVQVWVPAPTQAGSALGAGSVVVTLLKLLPEIVL